MNIREKMDQAFKFIQSNSVYYKEWCECKTQEERNVMLAEQLWDAAFQAGYEEGYKQCDEDVSMGG